MNTKNKNRLRIFPIVVIAIIVVVVVAIITVRMPKAEIISIDPDLENMSEVIASKDNSFINKNKIKSNDVSKSVEAAEEAILESVQEDDSLFIQASDNAKRLIENYINQIGELTDKQYEIKFETIEE
ncbi:DUF4230 domain-containing protein [Lachnospira multipara]|uniref:DUF4230 domain-containing protein n=1 Tax=Lachnospira multipara TaxID=28051 RepID=UPI000480CEA0|nr:DUF4230 domain-containing protein [Lachnospira multipara]